MVGALQYCDEEPMKRMLLDDFWRGEDSTGMAAIRSNGDVRIAKMASHPLHLFEMPKFKEALNANQSCAFLGHNRKATRGGVNDFNAHPYHIGHIVGAHNGTLFGTSHNDLEKAVGEKFPVDSMALIAAIATIGIEETIKLCEGAWAITWVDLKEGTINFLRNKERSLWNAVTKDNRFLYYASEWQTIHSGIRHLANREIKTDKQGCRFFAFAEDYHFKYSISDFMSGKAQKPVCKKLEGKEPAPFSQASPNFGVHTPSKSPWKKTNSSTTISRGRTDPLPFVTVEGSKVNPYAGHITREEFEGMAANGCTFCEAKIEYGDKGITIYKKDEIILCPDHSSFSNSEKTRIYVEELPQVA
jgi:hypothetical protein